MTETPRRLDGGTAVIETVVEKPASQRPWVVVVWDDPVNTMNYVTYVFSSYFGYPQPQAERLMLRVHRTGKAVVAAGPREQMETHVAALHAYGLWATMEADE